jgi:hypothetical protein
MTARVFVCRNLRPTGDLGETDRRWPPSLIYSCGRLRPGSCWSGSRRRSWLGKDFQVGLDRQRADAAGQLLAPVPGLCSTTASGLARRLSAAQWRQVEVGVGQVAAAAVGKLARARRAALTGSVTIDLDATDAELNGGKK